MRLSLATKALVLVAIPLCFEIGFVAAVAHLQRQAEADAERATRARAISDSVNKLTADIYNAWHKVNMTGSHRWLAKGYLDTSFMAEFAKLHADYKRLAELTRDNPPVHSAVLESASAVDEAERILNEAVKKIRSGQLAEVVAQRDDISDRLGVMFHGLIKRDFLMIGKQEGEIAEASTERQSAIRDQIMRCALIAVSFNVLFSVALGLFLVRGISSRLRVMSDNAHRFASYQPLHDVLKGSDEIAELDRSFHDMADDIQESMRMRQELVSMLTHDLRSPLTAMRGSFELFDAGMLGELNERGTKIIQLLYRNSSRMMHLIDDLLDVEKIKAGMITLDIDKVSLAQLFDEVQGGVADWLQEHNIKLEVEDSDAVVAVDKDKISRVLFNLVYNAVKYSRAGTVIKLASAQSGNWIEVTVADQGDGIAPEMLSAIFDRFQQIRSEEGKSKGGSGLGLAICQSIVLLHGGRIWATSTVGVGSVFHFTLPAA